MSTEQRMKRLPRPFVGICVAFAVIAAAWSGLSIVALASRHSDTSSRTYPAGEVLQLTGTSGDVTIVAEEREDIRVDARTSWSLARPDVELRREGDRLTLRGSCGFWGSVGFGGCAADFEIYVPLGTRIDARISSGDMRVAGARAATRLKTSSGDVRAEDVAAPLDVRTSSGELDVLGFAGPDVFAETSSGDVTIRAEAVPDRVTARTSSGEVTVAVPDAVYDVRAITSSGDTRVDVRQDPGAARVIEARSSSGDVDVVRLDDAR
jgi:DUF4097 and DUF4098 domain-containing protein YvlB